MDQAKTESLWVLRDAVACEALEYRDERPEDPGFPVVVDGRESYWAEESTLLED